MAEKIRGTLEEMKVPCFLRQFNSGEELLQSEEDFDIVFLDIMMDGLDGMKTAKRIRKKASCRLLVFISASRGDRSRKYFYGIFFTLRSWEG